jgi:hypothetical protein
VIQTSFKINIKFISLCVLCLKCYCDQIFISVFFFMIVKNAYKEAVTQNFSVISHIWPELYDDEVKSAILESSSVRESVTS